MADQRLFVVLLERTTRKTRTACICCIRSAKMVGFITAESLGYGVCYIGWLAVLSEYRNRKLASRLLETIETWSKEHGVHKLELDTQEDDLVKFYK